MTARVFIFSLGFRKASDAFKKFCHNETISRYNASRVNQEKSSGLKEVYSI